MVSFAYFFEPRSAAISHAILGGWYGRMVSSAALGFIEISS
jgi:hypothetical protein